MRALPQKHKIRESPFRSKRPNLISIPKSSRIDVKDRVITMLFSSAHGSFTVCVHNSSSTQSLLQVTPSVRTVPRAFNHSAARKTSVVFPERETSTTCRAAVRCITSSGAKSNSDAGTAVHATRRSFAHCAAIDRER
jgi:hypothetical protein